VAESEFYERFKRDTAEHCMVVLHDSGLYRHLSFRRPSPHSWAYWFELITVPGALIFRGDGESYVFSRIEDMFQFFRSPVGTINPSYWQEKLTDGRDRTERYDQEVLCREIKDTVDESGWPELASAVKDRVLDELLGDEALDRHVVENFAYWADPSDEWAIPSKRPDFQFADVWEWQLRDYDWWFLWACHAIVWGIAQYDAAKCSAGAA
jgi:hypothetical protein